MMVTHLLLPELFEQCMQWKYGTLGLVAALLLTMGAKARSGACLCVGAVLVVLLVHVP